MYRPPIGDSTTTPLIQRNLRKEDQRKQKQPFLIDLQCKAKKPLDRLSDNRYKRVASYLLHHWKPKEIGKRACIKCRGAFALFQLQEDMKKQLNGEVNYTEEELEKYIQSYKRVMVDSLWKLNVANIEATFFHVCQLVLQDPDSKREELRARARGLKISTNVSQEQTYLTP
ncbi:chaperone protein dnaJ 10-like [Brassica napus]|uniref:chaperone protein dnaJ 10-like n=1 Tax=Brassica napus TaxID=3708 RepID=UPI00207A0F93|nr:chaperone protein dnaJ 10-like [Brassica napus]